MSVEDGDQPKVIEQRGPFAVLAREIIHDRFGMQLIGDQVVRPDGTVGEQFWVNFPRQAVILFAFDNNFNLYLIEEFTYATGEFLVEAPGGGIEQGENALEAIKREASEEVGIDLQDEPAYLGTICSITSRVSNATHLFLGRVKVLHPSSQEPDEVIKLLQVPFEKAYDMVLSGVIKTASVQIGILKIKLLLDSLKHLPNLHGYASY